MLRATSLLQWTQYICKCHFTTARTAFGTAARTAATFLGSSFLETHLLVGRLGFLVLYFHCTQLKQGHQCKNNQLVMMTVLCRRFKHCTFGNNFCDTEGMPMPEVQYLNNT